MQSNIIFPANKNSITYSLQLDLSKQTNSDTTENAAFINSNQNDNNLQELTLCKKCLEIISITKIDTHRSYVCPKENIS